MIALWRAAFRGRHAYTKGGARRLPLRRWHGSARRALQMSRIWLAGRLAGCVIALTAGLMIGLLAGTATADILSARYTDPTPRYDHGILGDAIEHGTLELRLSGGRLLRLVLPETHVFEDTAPRLTDLDGDGDAEVIVVETDMARGARLAIYDDTGLVAATPYIGRTHRWLAPIGAADLDGDGKVEIAYIDRPHLAKTLRIWRFSKGRLLHLSDTPGLTNHRIGEAAISGGIRDCGHGPEMITADAGWQRIIASTFNGSQVDSRTIGPHRGAAGFAAALACK